MASTEFLLSLRPLLTAECAAEAPAAGVDPADLEQDVWVRLLAGRHPSAPPIGGSARWLRAAVRAEARAARRRAAREVPCGRYAAERIGAPGTGVEERVLAQEQWRTLRATLQRLPGRCPRVLLALLSDKDPTYLEIAEELGISQGSLGPVRSRCIERLRRMLSTGVAAPELWGMER